MSKESFNGQIEFKSELIKSGPVQVGIDLYMKMLNDEICKLRDKLNKSIMQGEDYNITYQISIELDESFFKKFFGNADFRGNRYTNRGISDIIF